eukprot:1047561-Prorocentrum_minimum.AAC.2
MMTGMAPCMMESSTRGLCPDPSGARLNTAAHSSALYVPRLPPPVSAIMNPCGHRRMKVRRLMYLGFGKEVVQPLAHPPGVLLVFPRLTPRDAPSEVRERRPRLVPVEAVGGGGHVRLGGR